MTLSPEEITTSIQKTVRESHLFSGEASEQKMDRYKFGLEIYHLIKHIVPNYTLGQIETLASEFWQEYSKPIESVPEEADQVEAVSPPVDEETCSSSTKEGFDPTGLINIDIGQVLHSENPVSYREFFTTFKKYLICSPYSISNSCVVCAINFLWARYKKEKGIASSDCSEPAPEEATPIPFMDNVNTTPSPNAIDQSGELEKKGEKFPVTEPLVEEEEIDEKMAMCLEENFIKRFRTESPEKYEKLRGQCQSMCYKNPVIVVSSVEGKPEKATLLINSNLVSYFLSDKNLSATLERDVQGAAILATAVDYEGRKIVNGFAFVHLVHRVIRYGSEQHAKICIEKILPRVAIKGGTAHSVDIYPCLFTSIFSNTQVIMDTFRNRATEALLCSQCGPNQKGLIEKILIAPCRTEQLMVIPTQERNSPDNVQGRLRLIKQYNDIVALC